ncbi:MAG: hypothetical protein EOP87_00155 [Verrucomicrobiaceae bacterium]|nr:MAG: hypothetical protein EOP87_00155 [Verrucomicrobiaceae bacterium]
MASNTIVYQIPGAITDTSIPILPRDALLTGSNNGVRFLFDLANAFSWTPGTPVQGKAVTDMAEISAAGQVNLSAGTLANTGNGIDFTSVTGRGCVSLPATVAANIWTDQQFIMCAYYKMPAVPTVTTGSASTSLFTAESGNSDHYGASAEFVLANWITTVSGRVQFARCTALNTVDTRNLDMTIHAGLVTQVACWRTATEWNARFKSSAGTTLGTLAGANTKNTTFDFSAKTLNFGPSGSFGIKDPYGAKTGLRLYRGWVENLVTSGRTPITVLDADYTNTIARAVYT